MLNSVFKMVNSVLKGGDPHRRGSKDAGVFSASEMMHVAPEMMKSAPENDVFCTRNDEF